MYEWYYHLASEAQLILTNRLRKMELRNIWLENGPCSFHRKDERIVGGI